MQLFAPEQMVEHVQLSPEHGMVEVKNDVETGYYCLIRQWLDWLQLLSMHY
jgi:hypothetical protein